jgi:hypothetical protein
MKTILEIRTRVVVEHGDAPLDENSVKGAVSWANTKLAKGYFETIDDEDASRVRVRLVELKQDGKRVNLRNYGTKDIDIGETIIVKSGLVSYSKVKI